jgi:hypothetical protein
MTWTAEQREQAERSARQAVELRDRIAAENDQRLDSMAETLATGLPKATLTLAHRRRMRAIAAELLRRSAPLALALVLLLPARAAAADGCRPEPVTPETPSGIAGCVHYGYGIASTWPGPGAARNDCVWPWRDCQTVRVTSLTSGISIIVTPTMFCDCYQRPGPNGERRRIIDLDPAQVRALGLESAGGLWPVNVQPVGLGGLPDTAMR